MQIRLTTLLRLDLTAIHSPTHWLCDVALRRRRLTDQGLRPDGGKILRARIRRRIHCQNTLLEYKPA